MSQRRSVPERSDNTTAISDAEQRASAALSRQSRNILQTAPIATTADAVAAVRFAFDWCEPGNVTYRRLFSRAIKFVVRRTQQ